MFDEISLLYDKPVKRLRIMLENDDFPEFITDLNIDKIVEYMCKGDKYAVRVMLTILSELCKDAETIKYRNEILEDLIRYPNTIERFLPLIQAYEEINKLYSNLGARQSKARQEERLMWDIDGLLEYFKLFRQMYEILDGRQSSFESRGLIKLTDFVCNYVESGDLSRYINLLKTLKKNLMTGANMKLHLKLNHFFKLVDALLVDISSEPFTYNGDTVEGNGKGSKNNSPVHGLLKLFTKEHSQSNDYRFTQIDTILDYNIEEVRRKQLSHISMIINSVSGSIAQFFRGLKNELIYYNYVITFMNEANQLGIALNKPVVRQMEERILAAKDIYDLSFALYLAKNNPDGIKDIVKNDISLTSDTGFYIITGPNQGGKTTYIRAAGILQVLAQAGIPVPASEAVISPVDMIFTHFPVDEKPEANEGRLGEELSRFSEIVKTSTEYSLVFMNESFCTTNSREASIIAGDLLKALAIIGVRGAFVTHLYELAAKVDNINTEIQTMKAGSCKLVSMISAIEDGDEINESHSTKTVRRTYKIIPGPPMKSSFASDIANQYNIAYEKQARMALVLPE